MEHGQHSRSQHTRQRLRSSANLFFLQYGYLATSIDAILEEALYHRYANKEALFADVLAHLTLSQHSFSLQLAQLPKPRDLLSLRGALMLLSHEIFSMMSQPDYLPLVRAIIAQAPRFPQWGTLFFSTVTTRGFAILRTLLQEAREQEIIVDVDLGAVIHLLLGGLLTYVIMNLVLGEEAPHSALDPAPAVVEVIIRALTP